MRYRRLDAAGDYAFGRGNDDFEQDTPEAVAQAVKTRLALQHGEWFLDTEDGIPWRTGILSKAPSHAVDMVIRERILSTPGVTCIDHFISAFDAPTRALTISVALDTLYGPATIQTPL